MSNIDIADVNPGDELTVKIGRLTHPESWATLSGKVRCGPSGYLELGAIAVRFPGGGTSVRIREIVSHTPAKPAEPENIGAAVEDADGQVWVRVPGGWRDTKPYSDGVSNYRGYDDINVVKVLHEGWPA